MSNFDRAAIERYLDGTAVFEPGTAESHLRFRLRACLDEINRQAAIIRAAVDDVPGYPCGCSHELDQDGVVTAVHTTCEAHRQTEAQVRRLRRLVQQLADANESGYRIDRVLFSEVQGALAETEGL